MKKGTRLVIVLLLLGFGAYFLVPSFRWYFMFDENDKKEAALTGEKLKVTVEEMVDSGVERLSKGEVLENELKAIRKEFNAEIKKINKKRDYDKVEVKAEPTYEEMRQVMLKTRKEKFTNAFFREILETYYSDIIKKKTEVKDAIIRLGLDLQGGSYAVVEVNYDHPDIQAQFPKGMTDEDKKDIVRRAIITIENRINKYGLSETSIQESSDQKQIIINIPGEKSAGGLRQIIETMGVLEFQLVSKEGSAKLSELQLQYSAEGKTIFTESANGRAIKPEVLRELPPDTEVLFVSDKDKWGVESSDQKMKVVMKESLLGPNPKVDSAVVRPDQMGRNTIGFTLSGDSVKKWADATGNNIGREIAIILDDMILAAPVVQDKIPNGQSQITLGNAPYEELRTLALILRSGSLSVPLEIVEENSVGASLGRDTIEKGLRALLIGAILLLIFMIGYYNVGGLIANIVLISNGFFLIAGLGMFQATLTLPGIAGIILTIGMAVDANVIIYERIKEEFRAGKTFKTAVNLGFDRAFWTIFDANITTFAAAIGLSIFGNGPIKGFAVTLCLGIVCSMFTSLFVTRLILDAITSKFDFKTLRVFSLLRGN